MFRIDFIGKIQIAKNETYMSLLMYIRKNEMYISGKTKCDILCKNEMCIK